MTPRLFGADIQAWANRLVKYLDQVRSTLQFKTTDARATQDGIILWNGDDKYVEVSKDGVYSKLGYKHSYGSFASTADHDVTSSGTAYSIVFNQTLFNDRIALGTPASRMVINQAGRYLINSQVCVHSTSGSNKIFYLWIRKNGVDVTGTMIHTRLTGNHSESVSAIADMVEVDANDYVELMYAGDSTSLSILADSGESFTPSSYSAMVTITQVD